MGSLNPVYQVRNSFIPVICLFLIMLGKYHFYIGFALKPYMVFLMLFLLFHVAAFHIQTLYAHEVMLLVFYFYYGLTGVFSLYPGASLRITLGILLALSCYFILRFLLSACTSRQIDQAILAAGICFNLVSLVLYMMGLKALGFQVRGDNLISYGVLVDRDYPRLIGLLSDPNLYVFYNTLFFTYFLTNLRKWPNKLGFILALFTSVLTFSRGGILALVLLLVLYMLLNNPLKQWKLLSAFAAFLAAVLVIADSFLNINILQLMQSRLSDFSADGGSGRFELWSYAWEYFLNHPIKGIGAGNILEYNTFFHGEPLYAHNTFLHILSESGLIGFLLYMLFLLLVFKKVMTKGLYQKKPYLFFTFIGFVLQILSLSLVIDEAFLLFLAILSCSIKEERCSNECITDNR